MFKSILQKDLKNLVSHFEAQMYLRLISVKQGLWGKSARLYNNFINCLQLIISLTLVTLRIYKPLSNLQTRYQDGKDFSSSALLDTKELKYELRAS